MLLKERNCGDDGDVLRIFNLKMSFRDHDLEVTEGNLLSRYVSPGGFE
jgi:hypothetical protein